MKRISNDEDQTDSLRSTRVILTLEQRGQQKLRYDPPNWIKMDSRACNYLMTQTNEYRFHQHPYAI